MGEFKMPQIPQRTSLDSGTSSSSSGQSADLTEEDIDGILMGSQTQPVTACPNRKCGVSTCAGLMRLHSRLCFYPPTYLSATRGTILTKSMGKTFRSFNGSFEATLFYLRLANQSLRIVGDSSVYARYRLQLFSDKGLELWEELSLVKRILQVPKHISSEMLRSRYLDYKLEMFVI